RWRSAPDRHESALLDQVLDPVLDVGCGPGRVPHALAASGRIALGIDPAWAAAHEAARRGAPVLRRSVFSPLPGEGRWGTVLLLDGNVGIGGDPVTLLRRCRELVRPGGHVIAEIARPGTPSRPLTVRVESGTQSGPWFAWAVVGVDGWSSLVADAGLAATVVETAGQRWFGRAVRP
ncbi:MAG: methyltransferase domain-containing protein, partial [Microthrixaceae bacterium]